MSDLDGREVWVAFDEWDRLLGVFAYQAEAIRAATWIQHGRWYRVVIGEAR